MTTLPTRRNISPAAAAYLNELEAHHTTAVAKTAVGDFGISRGRLIFALDATASRKPPWDHACRIQGEMFEATVALGGLNLQLVYYRGFNECKASRWLTTAADLHRVMRSVSCVGGETQIGRVLEHAIREAEKTPVGALVFIGDAMEEKPSRLCRLADRLGSLNVPIFVFHEGHDPEAEDTFRR